MHELPLLLPLRNSADRDIKHVEPVYIMPFLAKLNVSAGSQSQLIKY